MMNGSDYGWVFFAMLALLTWGVWGFMIRLLAESLSWQELTVLASLGSLSSIIVFALITRPSLSYPLGTLILAFLAGVMGFVGTPMLYAALERNPSAIVIVVTSLYPLVAIILSILILKELPTLRQAVGIALALLALVLITSKG